jgi:hypothetical protein
MTNQQIVTLYENSGLSLEELSQVFSMEAETIKLALVQGSAKYREELKKDPALFNDGDLQSAVMTMTQLLTAEEAGVKFRAAKFIINEKMGRHNIKNVQQLNINVNLFNNQLKKAKEAINKSKGIVDVHSEVMEEKKN